MQTAQELLRSNAQVRGAFEQWMVGKLGCTLEQAIDTMQSATWRLFGRSVQGKRASAELGVGEVGAYLVGQKTVRTGGGAAAHVRGGGGEEKSAEEEPSALKALAAEGVAPREPAISTAEQGLLSMLAAGLKSVGFAPEHAITAQRCEEIAFAQAQSVVEMVLADMEKAGKIGTTRQVIELREPGKATQETEGDTPAWFPRLVKLAKCGIPALLVGPAGCGKTTAVKMLAGALDRPFHRVSIAAGTDEGQLTGWLHPIGEHMRFDYVASVVSEAYEHGGVVLIDDVDLGDPNALGILNAAMDNGGWQIPLRHTNPVFTRHEDFYLCMAANTWGHGAERQYVGANQLDERTLSRVRAGQIRCDYDSGLETNLYGNHKAHAAESLGYGHRLRARLRALPGQARDVSTRDIESRYTMLDQFTVEEAWYGQFADWTDAECERVHVDVDHVAMTATLR